MSWIALVVEIFGLLLRYGPSLFKLVGEILAHLKGLKEGAEKEAFKGELLSLVKDYRATRDKRPLIDLLHRISLGS